MPTKSLFSPNENDSYLARITNDTVLLGENLFKKVTETFKKKKTNSDDEIEESEYIMNCSVSSCVESLPCYCKTEIVHDASIFSCRFGHACAFYNNAVYIYGGMNEQNELNNRMILYDIDENSFKKVHEERLPKMRYFATLDLFYSTEFSGYGLFLFGGKYQQYITNDTCTYNIKTGVWKKHKMTFYPPPMFGHASFEYQNAIFIHGGNMGNNQMNEDIWSYFEAENKWIKVISKGDYANGEIKNPSGRYFHSISVCVSENGQRVVAYVFGGLGENHKCVDDVFWSYSLNNGKWNNLDDYTGEMPSKRYGHSSMIINKRWLVVYGGHNLIWYRKSVLRDMYAYDIHYQTWSLVNIYGMDPMIHQFYGKMVKIDDMGLFIIFGGVKDDKPCSSSVYKYSPLFTAQYINLVREKLDEIQSKVEFIEKNKNMIMNYYLKKDLNDIKITINNASFVLVKFLQTVEDLNEKIRLANHLVQNQNEDITKKFQKNYEYYIDLEQRVAFLETVMTDSSLSSYSESDYSDSSENSSKNDSHYRGRMVRRRRRKPRNKYSSKNSSDSVHIETEGNAKGTEENTLTQKRILNNNTPLSTDRSVKEMKQKESYESSYEETETLVSMDSSEKSSIDSYSEEIETHKQNAKNLVYRSKRSELMQLKYNTSNSAQSIEDMDNEGPVNQYVIKVNKEIHHTKETKNIQKMENNHDIIKIPSNEEEYNEEITNQNKKITKQMKTYENNCGPTEETNNDVLIKKSETDGTIIENLLGGLTDFALGSLNNQNEMDEND